MRKLWKLATVGLAVTLTLPAQAFQNDSCGSGARQPPRGITRMSMEDRITQCQAMLPGVVEHMRVMERASSDGRSSNGARDAEAHEMSLAALRECGMLMTDMIAHLQQMERERASRRRR